MSDQKAPPLGSAMRKSRPQKPLDASGSEAASTGPSNVGNGESASGTPIGTSPRVKFDPSIPPTPPTTTSQTPPATTGRLGTLGHVGEGSPAPGRLGSLRGDKVTRGGAAKMRFKPTAPQRRVKREGAPSLLEQSQIASASASPPQTTETTTHTPTPSPPRGRGRGRGRGMDRPRPQEAPAIASGPFSQGSAKTIGRSRGATSGGVSSISAASTPRSKSSEDEDENAKEGIIQFHGDAWAPLTMPRDRKAVKKEEPKIKQEEADASAAEEGTSIKTEIETPPVRDLVWDVQSMRLGDRSGETEAEQSETLERLLFFQFPGVLPDFVKTADKVKTEDDAGGPKGKVKADPDDAMARGETTLSSINLDEDVKIKADPDAPATTKVPTARIKREEGDFKSPEQIAPDGLIGKLVVFKSGKVKMKFGDVLLDVTSGSECAFLQNIVALDTSNRQAFVMGNVERRFVCMPDVEWLLTQ
ncbi:hypothetical protein BZG36_01423 [Bifiguratus adelaidae]|uniref:DNA-directed RNA polymerase III subunit RPC4 n=1 Tax=Bifiguratus adelaidae TaxID=1938954 RepID=A0A261Y4Z8_9FUNG|nr:hypothetical protein BZG36_01423 [Bifiguratus adelaidae]